MAALAPIAKAWVSTTGETGAQNYDEFADDAEITAIVEANPRSMLAVEMAHCTPEMLAEGADRERSLRYGAERLQRLKDDGLLAPAEDFVVAYEIDAPTGRQLGIGLMAPTAEIWDAERMHIDEYHRGFRELGLDDDEFLARVREAGFDVGDTGTIELFGRDGRRALTPQVENGQVPETLPHQLVEERIVRGVLGWDPS